MMKIRLKMNITKTKVMVVDNTLTNVNNVLIENVKGYIIPGTTVTTLNPIGKVKCMLKIYTVTLLQMCACIHVHHPNVEEIIQGVRC